MRAYKFRSGKGIKDDKGEDIFKRDIELLIKDTIYIPTVAQLNDPAEAFVDFSLFKTQLLICKKLGAGSSLKLVEDSFHSFCDAIRSSGIYSLSKVIDNELMWSYYASGHCGYAIIYDTEVLAKSFDYGNWGGLYEFDMDYSNKLPRFDITRIDRDDTIKVLSCFLGNKSKAWEHEAEHRLVFDKGGKCLKIDYRAIKGFVFGCRMDDEDIDYVMNSFSGRDLEYYQIILNDDSYKLVLNKLEDRYPTAVKYNPNSVVYDLEELLEGDKFIEGVGYKYRTFVEMALDEVSREPFVTEIYQIIVSDDDKFPHIKVWAYIKQDGNFRPVKLFEYDWTNDTLIRV